MAADKKNYYFLAIEVVGKNKVLRALPGQMFMNPDGTPMKSLDNVPIAGGLAERENYPVGTIFGTTSLLPISGGGMNVMNVTDIEGMNDVFGVRDEDMLNAWTDYKSKHPGYMNGSMPSVTNPAGIPKASVKKTQYQILKEKAAKVVSDLGKDGFYVDDGVALSLVTNIVGLKQNTMLTGPTGTGKTEVVTRLAEKLGMNVRIFDMGSMYDPMTQMLGTHRLTIDEKTGHTKSVFDYSQFVEAVQQPGIVLLDELTRADPGVLNILFPCLDSRRMLPVEMAGEKETRSVKIHEDCVFVATANMGAEYTGTKNRGRLDAALADRFNIGVIELGYSPRDKESEFLVKRTGCIKSDADIITAVCEKVRTEYAKGGLSRPLSVRESLGAARLASLGFPVLDAMRQAFLNLYENEGVNSERSRVLIHIQSR